MNVNEMFPSKYLKGVDLKSPVTVVISKVVAEKMYKPGKGEVNGWVLYCVKAQKGVVLSKALANSIAATLSEPDTDSWPGKRVVLYPEPMTVAGKRVVAIRSRPAAANGANH